MLEYLVTSKVRRRLLSLLWSEGATGSATELAERADVATASVHSELRAMERNLLVVSKRIAGREVFSANHAHPEAELVKRLVAVHGPRPVAVSAADETLKGQLKALGAPLRGVAPIEVESSATLDVLVRGAELARRDPVVAKTLPVCFWNTREQLNAHDLSAVAMRPEEKHTVGFLVELTGELGGDRRLVGVAESLRDRRMTSTRPFFMQGSVERATRDFELAAKWGFTMNMDLDSFRALFRKFVRA